jgi:salicylate hydroxylase
VPHGAAEADALAPRSNLWLGRRAHLVHYPVGAGEAVNVVAVVDEPAEDRGASPWGEPADPAPLLRLVAGWAEPARRLVGAAPRWRRWPLHDRAPIRRWSDGPVVLLGDAAHPMLPFLAQGAAQSIEDAAVLACAVADEPHDLPSAFRSYGARRLDRTARVQGESRRQGVIYHLPRPASDLRDLVLSKLGADRLAARLDWLYEAPAEVRRFVRL